MGGALAVCVAAWREWAKSQRVNQKEKIMQKILVAVLALFVAAPAFAVSVVDYAALSTAVTTELSAGILAAVAGVGIIWGAKIGLRFVRSMFH